MRPGFELNMSSSSSSSVGSVGAPCFDDELVSQGNVQNDVVSPTLNTNEESLGIATTGIAFHLDPSHVLGQKQFCNNISSQSIIYVIQG